MKRMFNKKRIMLSMLLSSILLLFNTASCFAASSVTGYYNGIRCDGEVGAYYTAYGTTSCYGEHKECVVYIDVDYLDVSSVEYGYANASAKDYYLAEALIDYPNVIYVRVQGSHYVIFEGGSWSGYTDTWY